MKSIFWFQSVLGYGFLPEFVGTQAPIAHETSQIIESRSAGYIPSFIPAGLFLAIPFTLAGGAMAIACLLHMLVGIGHKTGNMPDWAGFLLSLPFALMGLYFMGLTFPKSGILEKFELFGRFQQRLRLLSSMRLSFFCVLPLESY